MKIAIDIDEVIVRFIKKYMEFADKKGFKRVDYKDVYSYNLWEVLGIKKELVFELLKEFTLEGIYDDLDFVEGSKEGIVFLKNNYDIYFITSRPDYISKKTRDFIFKEFGVLGNRVFFSGDVSGSAKKKDEICRDLGIDLIIEDNGEASLNYAEAGLRVLLLDKPWNQGIKHEGIFRCFNWGEILERVEEVGNGKK